MDDCQSREPTDVICALTQVEQSHSGGPLTYEEAVHQLTIAVYELKIGVSRVDVEAGRMDDAQRSIWQSMVEGLPTQAGPNAAQLQWFFGRLGAWSPTEWRTLAISLMPRGVVASAGEAFEATGNEAKALGASQALTDWGGSAWTAGRFFCQLHHKEMVEGVGETVRQRMAPRTQDEAAQLIQAGYESVRAVVLWAAVALAVRPVIRAATFETIWMPLEASLGLLAAENSVQ